MIGSVKEYPALEVRCESPDLLLAIVDDFSPTAIEERAGSTRVFFSTAQARDAARAALTPRFDTAALDVPDEDWAQRSQDTLTPITVGRITIAPPSATLSPLPAALSSPATSHKPPVTSHWSLVSSHQPPVTITIRPSMGFGTGHHATTRLCLAALQTMDLTGRAVLDVGTGSGVLAIAAARLGAARAHGIDVDADAIQSANENLALNPAVRRVTFEVADLTSTALPPAQVLTANLTGALLVRAAPLLLDAVHAGGALILSGLLANERDEVCRAFLPAAVCWEREEDGWIGLGMKKA